MTQSLPVHTVLLDRAGYISQVWLNTRQATLDSRLYDDGNERALLQFLKEESPVLPPDLHEMADRIGTAA